MYLISAERYKNANVGFLTIKKKQVKFGLVLKMLEVV